MAMVTCPEWISGKGNFIDCMHGGSISDDVINRYCYIQVDNIFFIILLVAKQEKALDEGTSRAVQEYET